MTVLVKNNALRFCGAVAVSAAFLGPALAADVAKGAAKAKEVCAACHGADGKTPVDPSYPILAGQHEDFLYRALADYKSEARKNAVMGAQAKGLSRADMKNLAAYYASLPSGLSHKGK